MALRSGPTPTILVAYGHPGGVGLFHGFDLLVCQADVKGCDGIGEVVFLGGTDDRCGYYRVVQHPGEGDVRHGDSAFFCDLLNCVGNGFVRVAEAAFGYWVVGGPCGVAAPGSCESSLGEGAVGDPSIPATCCPSCPDSSLPASDSQASTPLMRPWPRLALARSSGWS